MRWLGDWWRRRRHAKRVALLRKAECALARERAEMAALRPLIDRGTEVPLAMIEWYRSTSGEIGHLEKCVEHLRHDVMEQV